MRTAEINDGPGKTMSKLQYTLGIVSLLLFAGCQAERQFEAKDRICREDITTPEAMRLAEDVLKIFEEAENQHDPNKMNRHIDTVFEFDPKGQEGETYSKGKVFTTERTRTRGEGSTYRTERSTNEIERKLDQQSESYIQRDYDELVQVLLEIGEEDLNSIS